MISRASKKSKSTIHERLILLEKQGLVFKHNKHYFLTGKGKKFQTRTIDPPGAQTRTTKNILGRSHKQVIYICHRMDVGLWLKNFQGQMVSCYVPGLDRTVAFQFTRKGVQFQLRRPPLRDVMDHVVSYHGLALKAAVFLERRFKIKLVRPTDLGTRKAYGELAYMGVGMAEREVETGRRLWLYSWEGDGKPRFLFDKSRGAAEFEEAGKTLEDDAVETANFLEVLGNGEFREVFGNARALHAYMPELMTFMNEFSVGMREHMKLIKALQVVAESMRRGSQAPNPLDRLLADPALAHKFNCSSREEQDRLLGLK